MDARESTIMRKLEALTEERTALLRTIDATGATDIERDLTGYVQRCLWDLRDAIRDVRLPAERRQNREGEQMNSRYTHVTKEPSAEFESLEIEIKEFLQLFSRRKRGRQPQPREELSSYALSLMLGEEPFGKTILVHEYEWASDRSVDADSGRPRRQLKSRKLFSMELLSENEAIRARQLRSFHIARGPNGEALMGHCVQLPDLWPVAFHELVAKVRADSMEFAPNLPVAQLERIVEPEDREQMAKGFELALQLVRSWRGNDDKRNKATIWRWAGSEPIFKLLYKMLTRVWPIESGITLPRTQANDLACNLVLWVQYLVDWEGAESRLNRAFSQNRTVLGGQAVSSGSSRTKDDIEISIEDRTITILQTITKLRAEDVTFYWSKETVRAILGGILEDLWDVENEGLRKAHDVLSGITIPKLDEYWESRRRLLSFGSDRADGELIKWFRTRRSAAGKTPGNPRALAKLVFPATADKRVFLRRLDELVSSLGLSEAEQQSWRLVADWAADSGDRFWNVTPNDSWSYLRGVEKHVFGSNSSKYQVSYGNSAVV